jgi:hypothetical protein
MEAAQRIASDAGAAISRRFISLEASMIFYRRFIYAALTSTLALVFHISAPAQSVDRSKTIKEIDSLRKDLSEKEKLFLSPSAKDQVAFAEFLKQPNTGLIRLFPRNLYENRLITRGAGAYYSFARTTHEYGPGYDIQLERVPTNEYTPPTIAECNFLTGYGFIAVLGAVPIEKVTLEHNGVRFLAAYNPPTTEPEFREQQRRVRGGIDKNGYGYNRIAPVTPSFTYALRAINYGQSDLLVAFRVVRKEIDGSVVILWKRLKEYPRPPLFHR